MDNPLVKVTKYKLTDALKFGKHKGKLVADVIDAHPDYITWCMESVTGFTLDEEAMDAWDAALELRDRDGWEYGLDFSDTF